MVRCSASLTRDVTRLPIETFTLAKLGTLAVTLTALAIALVNNKSVFALVLDAWGIFASSFGPLLFLLAMGRKVTQMQAVVMLFSGAVFFYTWDAYGWSVMYGIAPTWLFVMTLYMFMKVRRHFVPFTA